MWLNVAAVAIAFAAGCSSGSPSPSTPTQQPEGTVTTSPRALTVAVSTDKSSVPAGGRLSIQVKVTNTGSAPVDLQFTSGCQTDYELLDAAGKEIGSSMQMCTQSLTSRALAPGASFTDSHVWIRGMLGMPQPPAGSMRVRGVLLATGARLKSDPSATVTLP